MVKRFKEQNCKVSEKVKLWSHFKIDSKQHAYIRSLCIQYGWSTIHYKTGREVADLKALDSWMRSDKCPVQKPLLKMTRTETSKIIQALENMVESKHSK